MLFNGRALIFTFSGTQVRIAEIERLQSLFKTSMGPGNNDKLFELPNTNDEHPAKLKCIVGDFNMPGIDWEKGSSKDQLSDKFYECTLDLFLKQNVTKTTRNKFGQTSNLLDLILTNDKYLVNDVLHMAPLGKSDRDVIAFNMNLSIRKISRPDTILYSKGNYIGLIYIHL